MLVPCEVSKRWACLRKRLIAPERAVGCSFGYFIGFEISARNRTSQLLKELGHKLHALDQGKARLFFVLGQVPMCL